VLRLISGNPGKKTFTENMAQSVKKWDIVLICFPYTDGSVTKRRPGTVIAVVINDLGKEDVIIAASQKGMRGVEIETSHPEFSQAGLRVASRILPGKLFTCAKSEVERVVGRLGVTLQEQVKTRLRDVLGI
jgi:mRNA interferase MazF